MLILVYVLSDSVKKCQIINITMCHKNMLSHQVNIFYAKIYRQ